MELLFSVPLVSFRGRVWGWGVGGKVETLKGNPYHKVDAHLVRVLISLSQDGFVNDLVFSSDGELLVAGVGQEHRFGRWWKERGVKNRVAIIPLQRHII